MRVTFGRAIRAYVVEEWRHAEACHRRGDPATAFTHLENAHVLGQQSTFLHVMAHLRMARWAVRERAPREFFGQVLRVVGAATKTFLGWVPTGNTGGANIPAFRSLPLSETHQRLVSEAKRRTEGQ